MSALRTVALVAQMTQASINNPRFQRRFRRTFINFAYPAPGRLAEPFAHV
ncbi:hypothetical protein CC1G_14399 [Coprinopsis cinerea okayama7|uniref:Uncharacterized protein n=1 Tax=Coprinopsis cinerea (strain Okayama-7 / 130 / ATCC MYA-4618 / FGSC 9003) TaxID=240176 RepID=D6RM95_COPC7|nr:hypothetical protein CC1G_14399 [Coprinopsis cinerea okayama7\|eukprot:XP_002911402.1 hypothetical protein CC1G_14399 [Coprinopsis cinerea okayama7\